MPRFRRYRFDERFFASIDSETKAYWLGFVAADGCVLESGLRITLAAKDAGHLEKIRRDLKAQQPVSVYSSGGYSKATIMLCSHRLRDDLIALGITPRKSLTLKTPDISPRLEAAFWRGMVDGDGCIRSLGRTGQWSVSLVGTFACVTAFSDFCRRRAGKGPRVFKHASIFRTSIAGNRGVRNVVASLYLGDGPSLDRKKALALEVMASVEVRQNRSSLTLDGLNEARLKLGSWPAVAESLGTSGGRLWHIRKRLATRHEELAAK